VHSLEKKNSILRNTFHSV